MIVDRNVVIPSRDGARLVADIWRPARDGSQPTLLHRTPYDRREQCAGGSLDTSALVEAGFNVVVQDMRGRFGSEGCFRPYVDEAADGEDTLAWIARQSWSRPHVGMIGRSYAGAAQWLAAASGGSAAAIAPEMAAADFYEGWTYRGGALQLAFCLDWLLSDLAPLPGCEMTRMLREPWTVLDHADRSAGYYRQWLEHPTYDSYWRALGARAKLTSLSAPALVIGGWYDLLLPATLADFRQLRRAGTPAGDRSRLVVGPWSHLSRDGKFASRSFAQAENRDGITAMQLRWFDARLRRPYRDDGEPRVRLYVMGADEWRSFADWPPQEAQDTQLWLASRGQANTCLGDGELVREPCGDSAVDSYLYDPQSPVPTCGGASVPEENCGPLDQRAVEMRRDVLCYTTAPLRAPLAVVGDVTLVLFASCSTVDTDFTGKLVDVHPDGRALAVCDGILRARYHESLEQPRLLEPGRICRFVVRLGATANVFRAGHRIRLEVSSSNFPRYDPNPNTGGPSIALEAQRPVTARLGIHHSREHPSQLILPTVPWPG